MGPIEHAVCQVAFKIEKKYQDNEFKDKPKEKGRSTSKGRR